MDEATSNETSLAFKLLLLNKEAGTIIGKGGANIKSIREQSECNLSIGDMAPGAVERVANITGTVTAINKAVDLCMTMLEEDPQAATGLADPEAERSLKVILSNNQVGRVIGKGGTTIKQIRTDTGASIRMDPEGPSDDRVVTIGGTKVAIVAAQLNILQIVVAMGPESGPPAKRASVGAPPGYPGYPPPPGYAQAPPQALGYPYGYSQPPPAYGAPPAYGQPAQYAPPPVDYASGAAGAPAPASDQPPAVLEQLVNQDAAGKLIGRGGQGIRELRQICRAEIRIGGECEPGTQYRKVTVSGSLEDVQMAISALLQRIPR